MRAPDAPLAEVSAALERALALKPDLARALSLLGVVRAAQDGNTTRGVSLITQAITLEPGNARHYLMLAQLAANARDAASTDAALARADRVAQGPDEKRQVAAVRQHLRPTP
jgi:cytochrome c-type biogenesis protein CcmH/NrfG